MELILSYYFLIIILIVFVLFFYTKGIMSSIRFKRKYNIKDSFTIVHVVVYTISLIDIGICVWALFKI